MFALTAAKGSGVVITGGTMPVSELSLSGCGGEEGEVLASDEDVALDDSLELPAGSWCGIEVEPDGAFVVDFTIDAVAGEGYELELELDGLTVAPAGGGAFAVAEDEAFLLELGAPAWLDADDLELDEENALVEDPDLAVELASVVAEESGLYADADADGEVGGDERSEGPVASASGDEGDEGDEGDDADDEAVAAGCVAPQDRAAFLPLLLGAFGSRLRRRAGLPDSGPESDLEPFEAPEGPDSGLLSDPRPGV